MSSRLPGVNQFPAPVLPSQPYDPKWDVPEADDDSLFVPSEDDRNSLASNITSSPKPQAKCGGSDETAVIDSVITTVSSKAFNFKQSILAFLAWITDSEYFDNWGRSMYENAVSPLVNLVQNTTSHKTYVRGVQALQTIGSNIATNVNYSPNLNNFKIQNEIAQSKIIGLFERDFSSQGGMKLRINGREYRSTQFNTVRDLIKKVGKLNDEQALRLLAELNQNLNMEVTHQHLYTTLGNTKQYGEVTGRSVIAATVKEQNLTLPPDTIDLEINETTQKITSNALFVLRSAAPTTNDEEVHVLRANLVRDPRKNSSTITWEVDDSPITIKAKAEQTVNRQSKPPSSHAVTVTTQPRPASPGSDNESPPASSPDQQPPRRVDIASPVVT